MSISKDQHQSWHDNILKLLKDMKPGSRLQYDAYDDYVFYKNKDGVCFMFSKSLGWYAFFSDTVTVKEGWLSPDSVEHLVLDQAREEIDRGAL